MRSRKFHTLWLPGLLALRGGISGGIEIVAPPSGTSGRFRHPQPTDSISPELLIDRRPATDALKSLCGPMTGDPCWT